MTKKGYSVNIAELIEVIHVNFARGEGTDEDLVRTVHQYWSKDGTLLAENDIWKDARDPRDKRVK